MLNLVFPETFPILETPRLRLRPMVPADVEAVFGIFADDEVTRFYDLETFTSREQAAALIARQAERFGQGQAIRWGITRREEDVVIGTCGVFLSRHNWQGELGYDLARPYWRQGIMAEALAAVIGYGFQTLLLNRFQALVIPGNTASEELLRKLGFQEEGILREYAFFKGRFYDLRCFSLLKREWAFDAKTQRRKV
ncbi:MAG: GNAT family N-acetyltransferase [Chloroflexi bacterium]|nr:GNAT family N-acetyltransferase [Chloroflexota bacterium]MCI0581166.1 GNAT family N-acetyltransferase [Chloroflexota bacterium]MCI0643465.1 GNAT family N-acetyltransferase [Chloroflexota bacterium]MCI0727463.1 GNAT family N-acetyltransferase [Chloroflexota bacterium]